MQQDSTVFMKTDSLGRVIEKWGNEYKRDNNANFRSFYFYDSLGNLIREKNYFLEDSNIVCKIIDTADYDEIIYTYGTIESQYKKIEETKYTSKTDSEGKIIGRTWVYRFDLINNKEYFNY